MSNEINPLFSNPRGLTDNEVVKSRQQHGENTLTPPKRTPLWKLYLEKYKDPIIKILLVAAVVRSRWQPSTVILSRLSASSLPSCLPQR